MKKYIIIIALLFATTLTYAQADLPEDFGTEDPDAPVDGGLAFLLAAGAGYGIKKLKDKKSKDSN